jgi:predicted PolB exonuclease-like 3'-5' exonuclease
MIDLSSRKILAFDLEVVAFDFETYDEDIQTYLTKYAKTDEEKKAAIENLVFNPFTSQIVAIGMLDVNEDKGCVLVNADKELKIESSKENINYICKDEKGIIETFWKTVKEKGYNLYVTFNGREFDCPFIMLRSLILDVKPSENLMRGSDFTFRDYHVDLMKELTFNRHSPTGARRKFSLDFYCRRLGIDSPKANGVQGEMVGELFRNNEYKLIADYCFGDVIATTELFKKWNEILNINK